MPSKTVVAVVVVVGLIVAGVTVTAVMASRAKQQPLWASATLTLKAANGTQYLVADGQQVGLGPTAAAAAKWNFVYDSLAADGKPQMRVDHAATNRRLGVDDAGHVVLVDIATSTNDQLWRVTDYALTSSLPWAAPKELMGPGSRFALRNVARPDVVVAVGGAAAWATTAIEAVQRQ
jgi:hypothetical protein